MLQAKLLAAITLHFISAHYFFNIFFLFFSFFIFLVSFHWITNECFVFVRAPFTVTNLTSFSLRTMQIIFFVWLYDLFAYFLFVPFGFTYCICKWQKYQKKTNKVVIMVVAYWRRNVAIESQTVKIWAMKSTVVSEDINSIILILSN